MKQFSQRTVINLFLIASLIIFAMIGLLSHKEINQLITANKWVSHTYKVIETIMQSRLDFREFQIRIANSIISNKALPNTEIQASLNAIIRNIQLAKQLATDNSSQQQRLEKLELLIKTKVQSLQKILQMQTLNKEAKEQLLMSPAEKTLSAAIYQLYNEITGQEHQLLSLRDITVQSDAQDALSILWYTVILTELLLLSCFILLNYNLSKRNHAEERLIKTLDDLKRSNIELEQFAYVASHDLQEPLRMVASYTQLLERRYSDKLDADAKEFISYAVDGAKRMQLLLVNLLSYSRIARLNEPFKLVDFDKVFNDTLSNLEALIEEKQCIITHSQFPKVMGDEIQLSQLLQNLISNALKFTPTNRPSKIHISAILENNEWIFSVEDNGIGIEPQYFEKIFIIFKRLHTRSEYPGTGIGLALCKKIVEKHGGRIWLQSTIDKGTTFFFTLPKI